MTPLFRFCLLLFGLALAAGGASAAQACMYNYPLCIGGRAACDPTSRQRLEQERRWAAESVMELTVQGRRRLRAGEVDVAADLGEMLVPNVRPVFATSTSCGYMGEFDYGEGRETEESLVRAIVSGTEHESADPGDIAAIVGDLEDHGIGASCNAEFRASFAARLRDTLESDQLAEAWLFLNARRFGTYPRLASFEGVARAPPLRWRADYQIVTDQIRRYVRSQPAGRALAAAIDQFWAERGTDLADDSKICPAATAQWARTRAQLLERIRASEAELRHAAASRPS